MHDTISVQRLGMQIGGSAEVPAAYVRVSNVGVERLERRYTRLAGQGDGFEHYGYRAPSFDFECRLLYDHSRLIVEYPNIGTRLL